MAAFQPWTFIVLICLSVFFQYAVILLLILIAQIAIGVVVFKRIESDDSFSFKDAVYNETEKLFSNYTANPDSVHVLQYTVRQHTDYYMSWKKPNWFYLQLECCGVNGVSYWNSSIPYSCCGEDTEKTCNTNDAYEEGCADKIYEILRKSSKVIGGVVIGIVVTEV